jgi:hypothetical protein
MKITLFCAATMPIGTGKGLDFGQHRAGKIKIDANPIWMVYSKNRDLPHTHPNLQ